ncbi:MAG: ribosome maturation factor RimM [Brachymonas sp.]|nr:ribosome maturation factor RimM [Brachymonas sp.]
MSADPNNALAALDATTLPDDAVEVAQIGEAWGIKGWFKVFAHSADPQVIWTCKRWYLQPPERGARHFSGTVVLPVSQVKPHGETLVASSRAIADRTAAELLRGARVFVPRSFFPSPEEDEYYWVDLIGCEVHNREGVLLGTVHDLLASGPQTTLVLKRAQGSDTNEGMIPFVDALVDTVDVAQKRIIVDWQPEFWD